MHSEGSEIPIFGVILAGGTGTRFWPLSRSQYPKQVLKILGTESLLQATIRRLVSLIPPDRLAVITSAAQEDALRLELNRPEWENITIWLEPEGRNTAAAIGLAAVYLRERWPQGVMAVFPADHYIRDHAELLAALRYGARWAEAGCLVTFGVAPHKPETGYGYLELGEALEPTGKIFHCQRFVEKPDLSQARQFLAEGRFLWNSGIFMFRRDVIWEAFNRHLPELTAQLARLASGAGSDLSAIYAALPSISFDYGVMEKAERVVTIPVNLRWRDLGSWGALYDLFPADSQGNIFLGPNAVDSDSQGCLFYSQSRLIATLGLRDTIVVDTADATLVCHRDRSQEVKKLVNLLQKRRHAELIQHPTVPRPWGSYTVIDRGPGYKVKQVLVHPGKRLSLQRHRHRAEHWVVVQGKALVTIGSETRLLQANQSVYVPAETVHRLENPGSEPLRLIEIQTGAYLEEDDIVRLEDDFWRAAKE